MERGVCPVLTTSSSAAGWDNQTAAGKRSNPGEAGAVGPTLQQSVTAIRAREAAGLSRSSPPPHHSRTSAQNPSPCLGADPGLQAPRSLQGAGRFLGLMRARVSDLVFQSREPGLLLLLSERKHFPVRSTQAAALLRLARKYPVWWLQVTESGCKESRIHAAARPEWLQLSLTLRNLLPAPDRSAGNSSQPQCHTNQTVLRPPSPSHPTKAGFFS